MSKKKISKTSKDENYKNELNKLQKKYQNQIKINKSLLNKNKKLKKVIIEKNEEINFFKNKFCNEIKKINNEINNIDVYTVWKIIMDKIDFEEYATIHNSGLFNKEWYIKKYLENSSFDIDPIYHYLTEGVYKGYNPNPYFNTKYYLEVNVDVRTANMNPLVHYIKYGIEENIKISKFDE